MPQRFAWILFLTDEKRSFYKEQDKESHKQIIIIIMQITQAKSKARRRRLDQTGPRHVMVREDSLHEAQLEAAFSSLHFLQ